MEKIQDRDLLRWDPAALTTSIELVQTSAQATVVDGKHSEKELEELLK